MPIRERVQRLWRLVVGWWRPPKPDSLPSAVAPPVPSPPAPNRVVPSTRVPTSERPAGTPAGEPLITGAVTVRMWIVGGRLVLGTSAAEAERALVTLLPDLDAGEQVAARSLMDAFQTVPHRGHAQAA